MYSSGNDSGTCRGLRILGHYALLPTKGRPDYLYLWSDSVQIAHIVITYWYPRPLELAHMAYEVMLALTSSPTLSRCWQSRWLFELINLA